MECFRASFTFLAGRNSVYCNIPIEILMEAFDVEEDMLTKLGRHEEVIFPSLDVETQEVI